MQCFQHGLELERNLLGSWFDSNKLSCTWHCGLLCCHRHVALAGADEQLRIIHIAAPLQLRTSGLLNGGVCCFERGDLLLFWFKASGQFMPGAFEAVSALLPSASQQQVQAILSEELGTLLAGVLKDPKSVYIFTCEMGSVRPNRNLQLHCLADSAKLAALLHLDWA